MFINEHQEETNSKAKSSLFDFLIKDNTGCPKQKGAFGNWYSFISYSIILKPGIKIFNYN